MSDWIVDVLSFQKIFSLCGLKGHIVEIRGGVTLVDNEQRTTECEDRARILGSRIRNFPKLIDGGENKFHCFRPASIPPSHPAPQSSHLH